MAQNGQPPTPSTPTAPAQPAAKSMTAAPKLANEVEMSTMPAGEEQTDIMQLARVGDIPAMQKIFDAGEFDATYSDGEGITPLHWAAINNQYAMCKYLIENGAEINKKGGESVATPLQWAAQRCHYYTVHLLLQHGADPLISDAQGYNTLHISTFNGNVFLITLLLHTGIPVDVADAFGHTGLMWSAYKGFPQCVDVFLRWGANVHATDEQGFTALHWALVKGSPGCIQKIIEYGADRFAKTDNGKTPAITAQELKTEAAWHKALEESGYDEDGHPITPSWPGASYLLKDRRGFVTKFTFLWPFAIVFALLYIVAGMPIFAGLPIALAVGYGMAFVAQSLLQYAPSDMKQLQKTPWLAGIFAGSLFWVGVGWLLTLFPATALRAAPGETHWLLNLLFAAFYGMTTYFYFTAMVADPGFVPKLNGIAEQRAVIDELIGLWKFDESNFCTTCMIRTPLRSKHCRRCQRCVAKHDHHCPWIYNCVGVNNHRHFFIYLINLTFGVIVFDFLTYYHLRALGPSASDQCNLLSAEWCRFVNADTFTLLLAMWATLQLTWVTMLLFVQFVQVSRAMTTYENMFGVDRHGAGSLTSSFTSTGVALGDAAMHPPSGSAAQPDAGVDPHAGHAHGPGGHKHGNGGFLKTWSRLLGVDAFVETAMGRGAAVGNTNKKRRRRNPYSHGLVANCKDFWCDPAPVFGRRENGAAALDGAVVNYTEMYETPTGMDAMRPRSGGGARRGGGYEAVAAEEV